jgi:hypothetical protein
VGKGFIGERVAVRATCHDGVVEVCLGAHAIGRVDLRAERAMPRRRLSLSTLARPAGAG